MPETIQLQELFRDFSQILSFSQPGARDADRLVALHLQEVQIQQKLERQRVVFCFWGGIEDVAKRSTTFTQKGVYIYVCTLSF